MNLFNPFPEILTFKSEYKIRLYRFPRQSGKSNILKNFKNENDIIFNHMVGSNMIRGIKQSKRLLLDEFTLCKKEVLNQIFSLPNEVIGFGTPNTNLSDEIKTTILKCEKELMYYFPHEFI